MKKNKIRISALILCMAALAACGNDDAAEVNDTETAPSSEEVTFDTTSAETSETVTESSEESESQVSDTADTSGDTSEHSEETPEKVFENNMEAGCFIPEKDGKYTVKHTGNDDIPWQVYILDEEFTDGLRYLYSNYDPDGVTECTVELKAGQYLYLICVENEWNSADFADTQAEIYYIGE